MAKYLETMHGGLVRVVAVPYTKLGRFNTRCALDKSSYDGFFTSRFGRGYCTAGQPFRVMHYTFSELTKPAAMGQPTSPKL